MIKSIKSWLSRRGPHVDAQAFAQERGGGYCPVCSSDVDAFGPGPNGRPGARCPSCGALERHRFLAVLLKALASEVADARQILEVAPTPAVARLLRRESHANYVGLDLDPAADGRSVDVIGDLCAAPFASDSIDLAVCFHVFEHIPNDRAAMAELARILSPSGFAFVQVPWNRSSPTDEDPTAATEERLRRFGQADHVRLYGSDFEERLRMSGLHVSRITVGAVLNEEAITRMGLRGTVWVVTSGHGEVGEGSDALVAEIGARLGGRTTW